MTFIFGGAFQGKLEYAKSVFNLTGEDIFICREAQIDFSCRCVYGIEEFIRHAMERGMDPIHYFNTHKAQWADSILICQDMFCGVVPVEDSVRAWRQETALVMQYLAQEADQVIRVFCGLGQSLKEK